jgi:hypothetical protein
LPHDDASREQFLEGAAHRAHTDPVSIRVRDLIDYWGAKGRGYRVVDRIDAELRHYKLEASPDFAAAHLDSYVQLIPSRLVSEDPSQVVDEGAEVELRVSSLEAASQGVESVNPQDSIATAYTIMTFKDYSQLAVATSDRSLEGYISWESIGRANLAQSPTTVRDCTLSARTVALNDPLLPLLPEIADKNFVFVRGRDQSLSGIITAADITLEFGVLATPYLMVGEIERRLRRIVDDRFDIGTIQAAVDPTSRDRDIESAEDLTMGELARMFEPQDEWSKLGWQLDRATFLHALDEVRRLRNRLMHFDQELPTGAEMKMLESFARSLKLLARSG